MQYVQRLVGMMQCSYIQTGILWLKAIRPFAFTASIMPILLGSVISAKQGYWHSGYFLLLSLSVLLIHTGTNLTNLYFDYINGVDLRNTFSPPFLVYRHISKTKVYTGGMISFILAVMVGLYLVIKLGPICLIIGVLGLATGYYYTAPPIAYKYHGLGIPAVFCVLGPVLVFTSHFIQTGSFELELLWLAAPIGILAAAILWANDLRDRYSDHSNGVNTLANMLSLATAHYIYKALLIVPYAIVVYAVFLSVFPVFSLIVLLTLLKLIRLLYTSNQNVSCLDIETAQLHFFFGLMLLLALLIS